MADNEPINMRNPEAVVDAYLAACERRHDLVPGARQRLLKEMERSQHRDPAVALRELVAFLESPAGQGFKNLEKAAPAEPVAPLRALLRRLPVRDADRLYGQWVADLAHLSLPDAAAEVVRRLSWRENEHFLDGERPRSRSADRVFDALAFFRENGFVRAGADLDAVARSWGSEFPTLSVEAAHRLVLDRLKLSHFASELSYNGEPIDPDMPSFNRALAAIIDEAESKPDPAKDALLKSGGYSRF